MAHPVRFDLHAVAVWAPGVGTLAELIELSRTGRVSGDTAALSSASLRGLPPNERRRASPVVRLALGCAERALRDSPFPAETLRMVFASDEGTGEVSQQMLEVLTTTRELSPVLFHNSVHNAPSGYFSIAFRNRQSANSVSLGQDSFASGLLCAVTEARTSGQPVLLVAYDPVMTEPLKTLLPVSDATATAWIISCDRNHAAQHAPLASLDFEFGVEEAAGHSVALPSWVPEDWRMNSSARGLAALGLLDTSRSAAHIDLQLGAQVLRLSRVDGIATC